MSRKPRRPVVAGLKREGRSSAPICDWCFDLPHRRPQTPYLDHRTGEHKEGCPGCGLLWAQEQTEYDDLTPEQAAWQLLSNQNARERAGVSTFSQALEVVMELYEDPNPKREGKRNQKYCNVCFGLPHRRPPLNCCPGCGGAFAAEVIPIGTGPQSSLAGFLDLDSLG